MEILNRKGTAGALCMPVTKKCTNFTELLTMIIETLQAATYWPRPAQDVEASHQEFNPIQHQRGAHEDT